MALVVEDGTGKADAESNASVAQYKARCDKLGVSYAGETDPQIENRLRLGFENMIESYRLRWAGNRCTTTQAGDWPRSNVPMIDGPGAGRVTSYYPNNVVPAEVVNANIDLAVRAKKGPLTPDLTQAVKRKKAGSVEIEYADYSTATKSYPAIDNKLKPFLTAQGGVKLVRG
jgi:hypothetical protein